MATKVNHWYHNIELEPGTITPGYGFQNIAITRKAFAAVDCSGRKVLDVACADAMMSVIACRRWASDVMAWDRIEQPAIAILQDKFGLYQLTHNWDLQFSNLSKLPPVDIAICSGLLYHVYDPLATILRVRGQVRTGGVLVIETAVWLSPEPMLQWNGGRYYDNPTGGNYWFPSVGLLQEWMSFLRLVPLSAAWIDESRNVGRFAVACRAVDEVPTDNVWHRHHQQAPRGDNTELCFREVIDWERCKSDADPVPVSGEPIKSLWDFASPKNEMSKEEIARGIVLRLGDTA